MESPEQNKTKDSQPVTALHEKAETTRSFGSYLLSPFYSSNEKALDPVIIPVSLSPLSDSSRISKLELDSPIKESIFEEVDFKSKKEESTIDLDQSRRLRRAKYAERKARASASQNTDDYYSEVEEYSKFRSKEMDNAKSEISRLNSILINQQEQMQIMKQMIEKDREFSHKAISAAENREAEVRSELRIAIQERESLSQALLRKEEEQNGSQESRETKSREEASAIRLIEEENRSLTLQLRELEKEKQASLLEMAKFSQEMSLSENRSILIKSEIERVGY